MRRFLAAGAVMALAACASSNNNVSTSVAAPTTAIAAGVSAAPAALLSTTEAARALDAFKISCPRLLNRTDQSGLTRNDDWAPLCAEAAQLSPIDAATFFADRFDWVEVGGGEAFATGYFEPRIRGSLIPYPGYDTPIYAVPDDLTRGTFSDGSGEGRGRFNEDGDFVLYHDRTAIEEGALEDRGLEIGWAADPVELFFLQIQGSGQLLLPDGGVARIGYANQNGREYVAIGRLLRERGLMEGGISMQRIVDWLNANPEAGRDLMRENKSYIFFRLIEGPGPLGALNVPVTPRGTVAADPRFVPLGAPVWLDLEADVADGLWIAQDTGGAIKGANRFDTFWGAGDEARSIAGGMASNGKARILLPKSAARRAQARR